MYSYHKNVTILLHLLKEFGIRHIVASAGTRNIPLVFSALQDDYFKCYSVVDERSAAFFALGIIQTTQEPAAIVCTSGTATCNYLSAVTEAFYQHLPLVVLTSDRNHYYLNQQEDQCIPQLNLYHDVLRKMVDLPIVRDELDEWYCGRLVNEALLELDHREKGPVQINFQIDPNYPQKGGDFILNQPNLPKVKKIDRLMADDSEDNWESLAKSMQRKKIIILYGQNMPISKEETNIINDFCDKYDVVIINEHIANRHVKNEIQSTIILDMINWTEMCPDIVITMGGHRMADPKAKLRAIKDKIEHWHVSPDGNVSDPFHCQTKIIECHQSYFFKQLANLGKQTIHPYLDKWRAMEASKIKREPIASDFEYSGTYAVKSLLEKIPLNSLLHISNSNSIRLATYFNIPATINFYCNRGTCGIDGSMSTYVAQSYLSKETSFLVIGDLSFFYDMNALWNHYINGNTRIMLINNFGGAILNFGSYKTVNIPGNLVNTAASHHTAAKDWVKSRGFKYLCSHNREEFDNVILEFLTNNSEQPILLEVFTDMDKDIEQKNLITEYYRTPEAVRINKIKSIIPKPLKKIIKSLKK